MRHLIPGVLLVVACGGGARDGRDAGAPADAGPRDSGVAPGDDSGPAGDSGPGRDAGPAADSGPSACLRPAIVAPAWLDAELRATLSALTGEADIAPGVRIPNRASATNRDHVRTYLERRFTDLGVAVEVRRYSSSGANVVATIPATVAPGTSRVVLGAHFDGVPVGPAAADNGTGVTLAVAAARWITEAIPCRTRDVEIVFFDQEEDGLVGSGVYATALLSDPIPTHAVHSVDMVSWDMDGDRLIELWLADAFVLADWTAAATAHGATVASRRFRGSDHTSFVDRRIPATGICEEFVGDDTSPYYHTAEDTFDKVDFDYLAMVTTVAVDVVTAEASE